MIDNFYRRADLIMDSFIYEVIAQWRIENRQRTIQYHAERGNILENKKDPTLENLLNIYTKDVLKLWKFQGQTEKNWRILSLTEEYDAIYKHWRRLSKMLSEDEWREYAKPNKFQDTPDDLLDKLENNIDRLDEERTFGDYKQLLKRYVSPSLGDKRLCDLRPLDIQSLYTYLAAPKLKKDKTPQ